MRRLILMTLWLSTVSLNSYAAKTYSFEELWSQIKTKSFDITEANRDVEAANLAHQRQARHWLPRASIQGRANSTNDPTATFFSNLGAREVVPSDFNTATLNHPGQIFTQQGSLVVDMPLYEGGGPTAATNALKKLANAKRLVSQSVEENQFAEAVVQYASLLSANNQRARTAELISEVSQLLGNYQIGSSTNPVGYAGLLGLKSLKNSLQVILNQSRASAESLIYTLAAKADIEGESWSARAANPVDFLRKQFGKSGFSNSKTANYGVPTHIQAGRLSAESANEFAKTESAKIRPRVGLFSEADVYHTTRNTGASTSVGAYMQWNIFNPMDWNGSRQKKIEAQAFMASVDSEALRARTDVQESHLNIRSLEANLRLMMTSLNLAREQGVNAKTLFQNGVINALQLVEVFNNEAELITLIHQTEFALAAESARNFVQSGSHHVE